jgi:hypothetical protein
MTASGADLFLQSSRSHGFIEKPPRRITFGCPFFGRDLCKPLTFLFRKPQRDGKFVASWWATHAFFMCHLTIPRSV